MERRITSVLCFIQLALGLAGSTRTHHNNWLILSCCSQHNEDITLSNVAVPICRHPIYVLLAEKRKGYKGRPHFFLFILSGYCMPIPLSSHWQSSVIWCTSQFSPKKTEPKEHVFVSVNVCVYLSHMWTCVYTYTYIWIFILL